MISNPKHGWCDFKIGDFVRSVSYITAVPEDLLSCFISYFKRNSGSAFLDEEGDDFTFVVSDCETYIISVDYDDADKEPTAKAIRFEETPEMLANELLNDLEDIDDWVKHFSVSESEKEKNEEKDRIRLLMSELKSIMEQHGYLKKKEEEERHED